jgi:alcohol dehydrogenase
MAEKMRAMVFHGVGEVHLDEVPIPTAGIGEAVVKVTLTTICASDTHIAKGEWPVAAGRIKPSPIV